MNRKNTKVNTYVETTRIGNWFREHGVRETIESILVAVLLALLFRAFEAEAFIIPTGSMATNLQGRHIDVACEKCEYQFRTGASTENPTNPVVVKVERVICPICQYEMSLKRATRRDHRSFSGDRILVNKFAYDFEDPQRWDVIVFKYPNNGKQNFIKRLVGLPGESVLIENGDIHTYNTAAETFDDRQIAGKSPDKLMAMLQLVDDTDYIAEDLIKVGWPSRWDQWSGKTNGSDWIIEYDDTKPTFSLNASDDTKWLRYRHLIPRSFDWDSIERGDLPNRIRNETPVGELITDYYAYNEFQLRGSGQQFRKLSGLHWVGDLGVRANVEVKSSDGQLILDVVEGGANYSCTIDVATGQATLSASGGDIQFVDDSGQSYTGSPTAETSVQGQGTYELVFVNADDELFLFVDGRHVKFDASRFTRSGEVVPQWSPDDPGDAEPIGIGGQNIDLAISRLEVLRDIYYTSKNRIRDEAANPPVFGQPFSEYFGGWSPVEIKSIIRSPQAWNSERAKQLFAARKRNEDYVFEIGEGKFFPMGDNSPESSDARIWEGASHVDQSYLLGKALFIYWPHAKTKPIPFFPNFERMKLIR